MSNRMGWLVGANAFLFTPLAVIKANASATADIIFLIGTICFLGVATTLLLGITIWSAAITLNVLHDRRAKFECDYLTEDRYKVLVMQNHEEGADSIYPTRHQCIHKVSILCQILVPILMLLTWCVVFYFLVMK